MPSRCNCAAATSARWTTAPYVMMLKSLPSFTTRALPNGIVNPGPDFTIPFGKARVVKEGSDLSIITYGAVVHRAEVAAAQLQREGINVEIVDLRSLSPYDWEAISATVRKTHRVIVAYEDMLSWGYGAEITARIADQLFEELDAPVKRVAAMDTFCAYQPKLEDVILPQVGHITAAVKQLLDY